MTVTWQELRDAYNRVIIAAATDEMLWLFMPLENAEKESGTEAKEESAVPAMNFYQVDKGAR